MELPEFKAVVDSWLDEHAAALAPSFEGIGTLDEQVDQLRKVMRLGYEAGFTRMGWPERMGGLGGSNLLRAYLGADRLNEARQLLDARRPGASGVPVKGVAAAH